MDADKVNDLTKRVEDLEKCCQDLRSELKNVKDELVKKISQAELEDALRLP